MRSLCTGPGCRDAGCEAQLQEGGGRLRDLSLRTEPAHGPPARGNCNESEAEKEVARNKAGNQAELLVNNKIQAMITHELDGHGVNHRKFIFFTNKKSKDTVEIDSLVVTKAGIFIIEVKG